MKIKIKNKNTALPNCWKSCGVDKDAWDELQNGKEIEVKQISNGIEFLVDTIDVPKTKIKKEAK
tara:strand:+ start:937 stop:1128 length:192 start_codon:yes stop_codon:yes gene_type:complete